MLKVQRLMNVSDICVTSASTYLDKFLIVGVFITAETGIIRMITSFDTR